MPVLHVDVHAHMGRCACMLCKSTCTCMHPRNWSRCYESDEIAVSMWLAISRTRSSFSEPGASDKPSRSIARLSA